VLLLCCCCASAALARLRRAEGRQKHSSRRSTADTQGTPSNKTYSRRKSPFRAGFWPTGKEPKSGQSRLNTGQNRHKIGQEPKSSIPGGYIRIWGGYSNNFTVAETSATQVPYVWAVPAAAKTPSKGGALHAPPFALVFRAAGAAQTPEIDDFRSVPKPCIQNSAGRRCLRVKQKLKTKTLLQIY
jgi:hypothetical protein